MFVSSVSCKRSVLAALIALPKNALLPSVSQGRGQVLLLCSIQSVRWGKEGLQQSQVVEAAVLWSEGEGEEGVPARCEGEGLWLVNVLAHGP